MIEDMHEVMKDLAVRRPIFHSEADFQHALAWAIHEKHKKCKIRLEYKFAFAADEYTDMVVKDEKNMPIVAMELKYKTKKTMPSDISYDNETFKLTNQAAHNHGRYDFWKDVRRMEIAAIEKKMVREGYAIFLTNDSKYWEETATGNTSYEFRIDDTRKVSRCEELKWHSHGMQPKASMKGKRTESIKLQGKFALQWKEYKEVEGVMFKYLLLKICNDNEERG